MIKCRVVGTFFYGKTHEIQEFKRDVYYESLETYEEDKENEWIETIKIINISFFNPGRDYVIKIEECFIIDEYDDYLLVKSSKHRENDY